MLMHPFPILQIQFRPLGFEFHAPVSGFHGTDALGRGHHAFNITPLGIRTRAAAATRGIPPSGPRGQILAFGFAGADAPRRHLLARHETEEADEDGADFPGRVEAFGVEIADAEAEAGGGLEAAGGGVHSDGGRGEGVVGGEEEGAPVLAVVVGG